MWSWDEPRTEVDEGLMERWDGISAGEERADSVLREQRLKASTASARRSCTTTTPSSSPRRRRSGRCRLSLLLLLLLLLLHPTATRSADPPPQMRVNMDPLTPTTSTLSPAIAHIADTAASLASALQERVVTVPRIVANGGVAAEEDEKRRQRQTVRWVLEAPRRLRELVDRGQGEAAERDWREVEALLNRWKGVGGAEEVRRECGRSLGGRADANASHG